MLESAVKFVHILNIEAREEERKKKCNVEKNERRRDTNTFKERVSAITCSRTSFIIRTEF